MAIKLKVADPQGLPLRTEQDAPLRLGVGEGSAYRSYDDLTDKPQINGVTLEGNKTAEMLGITENVYMVEYGATPFSSVLAAYQAGKLPVLLFGNAAYIMTTYNSHDGEILFELPPSQADATGAAYVTTITVRDDDYWSYASEALQSASKRVAAVSASSTDDEYPSAKALWNQAAKYPKIKRFAGTSEPGGVFTFDTNNLADVYNAQTSGGQVVFIFDASQRITYRVNYCFIDHTDPAHERIVVYATADHVDTTQEPNFGISATFSDALYAKAAAGSQILYPLTTEYQEKLTFDETPDALSENPVTSRGIAAALSGKQNALTFDDAPTEDSTNPVKSGGVYTALGGKQDAGDYAVSATGDTTHAAKNAAAIPYGECDSTSTATAFTATVPGITELRDGVCVMLRNNVVTSASGFTIDINGLGAKPSYNNMTLGNDVTPTAPTRDTTIFNINYAMLFVYSEDVVEGGCWIGYRGYDANTNTIGYQIRTNTRTKNTTDTFYRYRLLFASADDTKFVPANTSTSTNATTARTPNTRPINPFGEIIYYGTTAAVTAGNAPGAGNLWQEYVVTIGYSFAPCSLTAKLPVYLKCTPQTDGSAIMDANDPIVQALPTTADGQIYIYLGTATSGTAFELVLNHPVYHYKDNAIRLWVGP